MKLTIRMGLPAMPTTAKHLPSSIVPGVPAATPREVEEGVVATEVGHATELVVRVISPSARNPVHRAFRALLDIGIQIAHARVRLERGNTVQILQLTELDNRSPARWRVPAVLATLRDACRLPCD